MNRYAAFGSLGNTWWDRDDLDVSTSYGASYTDRQEEQPDPQKEERFAGFRLDSDFRMTFGQTTTFDDDVTANVGLADTSDFAFSITNSLGVRINNHVSLKVSLQWLFNSEPSLEDVDLIARVVLEDPDGTPGSGDEFYRTVAGGGTKITLGEDRVRKEQLDTIFRTGLVIDF